MRLKGLNKVRVRNAAGVEVVYWYAWKGGPKLSGKPGSAEFIAGFTAAVAARRAPEGQELASLVARYRASPDYNGEVGPDGQRKGGLAATTRRQWGRFLDKIADKTAPLCIGDLSFKMLDDRRCRAELLAWRDQFAGTPRTADYAMQVLSRVLTYGVERGLLAANSAAGVRQLYSSDRADQIWEPEEIARYVAAAKTPEVAFIVRLACLTGLRREDLCRLSWAHVGDTAIVMPTGKSRRKNGAPRKAQVIPLLAETKTLLAEIRARQAKRLAEITEARRRKKLPAPTMPTTVLSNNKLGRAWTPNGLESQVIEAKTAAKVDKHLHDARGTFATRLRIDGQLTKQEIADIMAWDEDRVERLLNTYVDRAATVLRIADRLNRKDAEK